MLHCRSPPRQRTSYSSTQVPSGKASRGGGDPLRTTNSTYSVYVWTVCTVPTSWPSLLVSIVGIGYVCSHTLPIWEVRRTRTDLWHAPPRSPLPHPVSVEERPFLRFRPRRDGEEQKKEKKICKEKERERETDVVFAHVSPTPTPSRRWNARTPPTACFLIRVYRSGTPLGSLFLSHRLPGRRTFYTTDAYGTYILVQQQYAAKSANPRDSFSWTALGPLTRTPVPNSVTFGRLPFRASPFAWGEGTRGTLSSRVVGVVVVVSPNPPGPKRRFRIKCVGHAAIDG